MSYLATACNINIIININSDNNIVTITININIIINIKLLKNFMMSYLACSSSTCSLLGSVTLGTGIGEPGSWEALYYFFSALICLHLKTLMIVKSCHMALQHLSPVTIISAFLKAVINHLWQREADSCEARFPCCTAIKSWTSFNMNIFMLEFVCCLSCCWRFPCSTATKIWASLKMNICWSFMDWKGVYKET